MSVVALREAAPDVVGAPRKYELMEPFLVPVKDLVVPTYQRETNIEWCERTAGEFDPNLFHCIVVERTAGKKWAVNQGCHRVEIARTLGIDRIWAQAAKTDQPGELFVAAQQKQRPLSAYQQHHALRDDRVAQALRVDSLLRSYGLRADHNNRTPGSVNGITMLYRLMFGEAAKIGRVRRAIEPHEPELTRALAAIHGSWGPVSPDYHTRGSVMIEALTELFVAHPGLDDARVREVLSHRKAAAVDRIAKDMLSTSSEKGHKSNFVARVILEDYNAGFARREKLNPDAIRSLW